MKKLLMFSAVLVLALCSLIVFFPQYAGAEDSGYDITSYHTDIQIGEDNTYHITETISVDFHEPRHGIYRYIPYRQKMTWDNGQTEYLTYNTKVKSVEVEGAPFETYNESGDKVIKIGDPDEYVTGTKVYTISYDHALGNDKIAAQDFVYYNLIGTNWDCNITNYTFSVTLPKEFDTSKIWLFTGAYGSAGNGAVQYSVSGNTILGSTNTTLAPGEGLTLQMDLPEGYFVVPPSFPWQMFFIILALVLAAISAVLFVLFGRDGRLVVPVEFYAPEGITSAEAGYIIDTSADNKDIVSLVIYWASKGYLSIELIAKDDFKLKKLKDLPERAYNYEKYMFEQLFNDRDTVTVSKLKDNFFMTIETTKQLVADHYATKENRLYSSRSKALGYLIRLFSLLLLWFPLFITLYELFYSLGAAIVVSIIASFLVMLPLFLMGKTMVRWQGERRAGRSVKLILAIIFSLVTLALYVAYMTWQGMILAGIIIAVVTVFLSVISVFMRKRTLRGSELLGKLLGFKNFLERAEKPRIEQLVEQNPAYFYDCLPFAYVLGVTDKWAKKFEGIAIRPPDWYHDSYGTMGPFSVIVFQASLFHSMAFMNATMVSRPAPQVNSGSGFGGGGLGGGGFSGGGFGGGGGGSW